MATIDNVQINKLADYYLRNIRWPHQDANLKARQANNLDKKKRYNTLAFNCVDLENHLFYTWEVLGIKELVFNRALEIEKELKI